MPSHASVTLIGHAGSDPVVKQVGDNSVSEFSVAVSTGWGEKKQTDWYKVACWRNLGKQVADRVKKGGLVMVQGKLAHRTYQKKDGATGMSIEVDASEVLVLGGRGEGQQEQAPQQRRQAPPQQPEQGNPFNDDNLPF